MLNTSVGSVWEKDKRNDDDDETVRIQEKKPAQTV